MNGKSGGGWTPDGPWTHCVLPQPALIIRNVNMNGTQPFYDDIYFDAGCSNAVLADLGFCTDYLNNWAWTSTTTYAACQIAYCDGSYKLNLGGIGAFYITNGFALTCAGGVFSGDYYHLVETNDDGIGGTWTNSCDLQFASPADITNNCLVCVGTEQPNVITTGYTVFDPCNTNSYVWMGCGFLGYGPPSDTVWYNNACAVGVHRTATNTWVVSFYGLAIETNSLTCVSGKITGTVTDGLGHTFTFNPP